MGVGAGLYVHVRCFTKVHVRYLISWWVLVLIRCHYDREFETDISSLLEALQDAYW